MKPCSKCGIGARAWGQSWCKECQREGCRRWYTKARRKTPETDLGRFKLKYRVNQISGCWEWTGYKMSFGYGGFGMRKRHFRAHQAAWLLFRGEIPKGSCVLHHCDNPSCVNPNHLYIGTHADNARDKMERGRMKPLNGEMNPNAKLTAEQVLAIRAAEGSQDSIAKRFDISQTMVSRIKRGVNWKIVVLK